MLEVKFKDRAKLTNTDSQWSIDVYNDGEFLTVVKFVIPDTAGEEDIRAAAKAAIAKFKQGAVAEKKLVGKKFTEDEL